VRHMSMSSASEGLLYSYVVFVGAGGDGDSVYGEKSGEIVFYHHRLSVHQL